MKESDLNSSIESKLEEFESMEQIVPGPEWNAGLNQRLQETSASNSRQKANVRSLAVMTLIVLNILVIYKGLTRRDDPAASKDMELALISQELLIHPINTNN